MSNNIVAYSDIEWTSRKLLTNKRKLRCKVGWVPFNAYQISLLMWHGPLPCPSGIMNAPADKLIFSVQHLETGFIKIPIHMSAKHEAASLASRLWVFEVKLASTAYKITVGDLDMQSTLITWMNTFINSFEWKENFIRRVFCIQNGKSHLAIICYVYSLIVYVLPRATCLAPFLNTNNMKSTFIWCYCCWWW